MNFDAVLVSACWLSSNSFNAMSSRLLEIIIDCIANMWVLRRLRCYKVGLIETYVFKRCYVPLLNGLRSLLYRFEWKIVLSWFIAISEWYFLDFEVLKMVLAAKFLLLVRIESKQRHYFCAITFD